MLNRTSLLLLVFVMALDIWAEIGTEESIDAIKASLPLIKPRLKMDVCTLLLVHIKNR